MNFDFSDEDKLIRDQTTRFLSEHCDTDTVRDILEGNQRYSKKIWQGLAELGLTAATIPEQYEGLGSNHLALCLVAEQLGAYLAPTPFASTLYLVTEAITLYASEEQKQQLLPQIAGGKISAALAVIETSGEPNRETIKLTANNERLNGKKLLVIDGGIADIAIVLARDEQNDLSLYLTDLRQTSVKREDVVSLDPTINTAQLTFINTDASLLGKAGCGWEMLDTVYNRAAVLFAFEQLGGATHTLAMAVEYAKQRFAFGRAIGSFQAIKHMLANMYVATALAQSNCYYAAWALSTESSDLPLAAATARVSATNAFQLCAKDNIQTHGGMGFTWESDCHLYYRRSNFLALNLGGLTTWQDRLINSLHTATAV